MSINRGVSLLNSKIVYDITKFSHLDYPDHLSCIVWFSGCNMRCNYCYNSDIVYEKSGNYTLFDVLDFLRSRVDMLDAVVLSGGEASSYELLEFCREIKKMGFLIKLDTNGTNFKNFQSLYEADLLDFVALDYKAPVYKYQEITKSSKFDEFSKSLKYLINGDVDFEVRTTVHADMLNEKDINSIIRDLKKRGYGGKYYLQSFLDTGTNIGNVGQAQNSFDKSLLSNDIELVWR